MENFNEESKYKKQERYDKKNGLMSKSYKLHKKVVIEFKNACKKCNISQATQLEKMMIDFITKVDEEYN